MTKTKHTPHAVLKARERLIVRKEHVLCTRCGTIEPVHPGHGTPMPAFISALESVACRHAKCRKE